MDDTAAHAGAAGVPVSEANKPRRFITVGVVNDAGSISEKVTMPLLELGEWVKGRLVGDVAEEGLCLTIDATDETGDPVGA